MKIKRLSILSKLIISLLLIVTPMYTINFVLNNKGAEANRKELSKNLTESAHSFHKLIEAEIQKISFAMNQNVSKIALLQSEPDAVNATDQTRIFLDIQYYVKEVQNSSHFIKESRAFIPAYGMTIFNDRFLSSIDFNEYTRLVQEPANHLFLLNDRLLMNIPYVTSVHNAKEGLFIFSVELYKPIINLMLDDIVGYENGGTILFDVDQNWNVSSTGFDQLHNQLIQKYSQKIKSGTAEYNGDVTIDSKDYFVAFDRSSVTGTTLLVYAPKEIIFSSMLTFRILFQWMSIISLLAIILVSYWVIRTIHKPLITLMRAFREVDKGNLELSINKLHNDEFGYIYDRFNIMINRLNESIRIVYEQEIRNQRSELKRLQSQINPHFLYNTYFVLSRLIRREDIGKASMFSQLLGQYFKFITKDHEDMIPLEQEVEHTKTYLKIQNVCYPQIVISFDSLPESLGSIEVPRLILQPIIENCYKHGFKQSYDQGKLSVGIRQEHDFAIFTFEDNGIGLSDGEMEALNHRLLSDSDESSGLVNVHRRIQLHFGEQSGIRFFSNEAKGITIELRISTSHLSI